MSRPAEARELAVALKERIARHNAPIFAAAIAFFAFLALIPALTAVIGVYGLVADPNDVTRQITDALSGAPESTRTFLVEQMTGIAAGSSGALGFSVAVSLALALFSASGAVANLMKSLNVAYDLEETRKPWTLRGVALILMIGGIVVLGVVMFLMAVLPPLLATWGLGDLARFSLNTLRYPILGLVMAASLSLLYRLGPDHGGNDRPLSPRLFSAGGLVATVLFVVLSGLFSFYTANLGSYGETYGPLATIIVLLLWFQLSALSVIIGAELDAELSEREWRARTGLEDPHTAATEGGEAAGALVAAMTAHDVDAVLAQWHRRGVHRHPLFGELAVPAGLREHLTALFGALPDLEFDIGSTSATPTTATVRYRMTGTFTGTPWAGTQPNGRGLDIDVVVFLSLEDGFIVEVDELFDSAAVADQLGFRPGDTSPTARIVRGLGRLRARIGR
ncbi:MAG: YhjD/YihY/BrkB family envelope integrity protein [Acidimicrobiales bacterium]